MLLQGLWRWLRGTTPARVSDELWQATLRDYPFLQALNPDEQHRLRQLVDGFLAEKEFTAAGGLVLEDAMCVAIAAQGCLPILNLGLTAYRDWVGIIVYPDEFIVQRRLEDEDGIVHEFDDVLSGEAWEGGPLLISWHDVGLTDADYSVVIHEFAHKLDMRNGRADGLPALHSGLDTEDWETTLLAAYDQFCAAVDQDEETAYTDYGIDPYASEHPAEFFAVLSETFFLAPQRIANRWPALYALFVAYYRQNPLSRSPFTNAVTAASTVSG